MFHIKDKTGKQINVGDVLKDGLSTFLCEVKFGYSKRLNITGWYVENSDLWFSFPLNPTNDVDINENVEIVGKISENTLAELSKPFGRSGYGKNFNVIH